MKPSTKLLCLTTLSLFALVAGAAAAPLGAVPDNTPPGLSAATDKGAADPAKIITITVHLKMTNRDLFDSKVSALYRPGSASFHHWLTDADLRHFAPSPAAVATVRAALEANGLTIVAVQKDGFSIRARGPIGTVAAAFHTAIHEFVRNGESFRANISNARLGGEADSYVDAVAGIESHIIHPLLRRAIDLRTGKPRPAISIDTAVLKGGLKTVESDMILGPPTTASQTSTVRGVSTTATYEGVVYDPNPALAADFTAAQLQKAYHLAPAYAQGLDGTGQTVVLLEAFGYPTIEADANTAAKLNKLPALTADNLNIIYPEGMPSNPAFGVDYGWNAEIALDVQTAHAIAPGATILVVNAYDQDSEDFAYSMQYIVDNDLGSAVSDSWEEDGDAIAGPAEQEAFEDILVVAAAKGISFQFSTGDSGDNGVGTPRGAADMPSTAPHATAVGGTSLLNIPGKTGSNAFYPMGWGTVVASLFSPLFGISDPPSPLFYSGAGGGESVFWPKPEWQQALPGIGRQVPDVSALADPFTGVAIVLSNYPSTQQLVQVGNGGTSLASPIFTALWAIAQQKAGHALGQAAPTVAGLAATFSAGITDVLPLTNTNNVTGSIATPTTTTDYSTAQIFAGTIPGNEAFTAALVYSPQPIPFELAQGFGLDTSLTVTKGWDNVTGYGTPQDGLAFINEAASYGD